MWRMALQWVAILTVGISQTLPPPSARFGSADRCPTGAEVVQIVRLAAPSGKVWTLRAENTLIIGVSRCRIFLEAEQVNERIRRGRAVLVEKKEGTSTDDAQWRITNTLAYAHVPDRAPGQLSAELDLTWPFLVSGDFDDDRLVSLVTFIRASPRIPGVREDQAPRNVAGDKPISSVAREGNSVIVNIRIQELQGQTVTLERRDTDWVITAFQMWIV